MQSVYAAKVIGNALAGYPNNNTDNEHIFLENMRW